MTTSTPDMTVPERNAELTLAGGRKLSYATYGAADGPLVVVLDGPGSRGLARAAAPHAARLGIRLAAPDRPGFFSSTPTPGYRIVDWPSDHAALLDALGTERSGILAQSGGTPYAMAAAAALPERTTALAFVGAIHPLTDAQSLAATTRQIRAAARLSRRAPWVLRLLMRAAARRALKDPAGEAARVKGELPPADTRVLSDPAMMAIHERAVTEILSHPDEVAREMGLLARPWGVDPEAVAVPVELWAGGRDAAHPPSHSHRLAARLGNPAVHVLPDAGTFALEAIYDDALRFAAGR